MIASSGQLNAKQRELLELQALAQRRLKGARSNFSEGIKVARETKRDLEWTQKRVKWVLTSCNLFLLCSSLYALPPGYSMIVVVGFRSAMGLRRAPLSRLFLANHVRPICSSCEIKTRTNWKFPCQLTDCFSAVVWNPRPKLHTRKNIDEHRRSTPMTTSTELVSEQKVLAFDFLWCISPF